MSDDIELNWLKKAAGITDQRNMPTHAIPRDRSKLMKEQNIKPGSKEYIDLWFPKNDLQMPVGFRGRKK